MKFNPHACALSKAACHAQAFRRLSPESQETFMWLVLEWHGTIDELLTAVSLLSQDDGTGEGNLPNSGYK